LGAGSFGLARHDHVALTIPFPGVGDRMTRLEAACRVLPALWRGERVTDPSLGLSGASLGPIGVGIPRLVVGGASERAIAIAARYCDGLNLSTANPDKVTEARRLVERFCSDLGRPEPIAVEAQLWVRDLWADARSHLRAFEASGAEAVIMVLDEEQGPNQVRRLADAVL
jgi:alkanesulfonate monooxygenase SsuD/methylene tetrahydromethanopterin reductase-like flavin-dependent oxidoreductase (luciferase family)